MFFGKPSKPSRHLRFQQKPFARRLRLARAYKRPIVAPSRPWRSFFESLGIGSRRSQAGVLLAVLLLVYLVYVPNFLYLKTLTVTGGSQAVNESVKNSLSQYLNQRKFAFWPQKNLLLLNKTALQAYLEEHNREIQSLDKIDKEFFGKLSLKFSPRFAQYLLLAGDSVFQVSNDGVVLKLLPQTLAEALAEPGPELVPIQLNFPAAPSEGSKYLPDNFLAAAQNFRTELGKQTQLVLESFALKGLSGTLEAPINEPSSGGGVKPAKDGEKQQPDQVLQTQQASPAPLIAPDFLQPIAWVKSKSKDGQFAKAFKLYLDTQNDAGATVYRLSALLDRLSQQRQTSIAYIDMRFAERGFVCLKGAACASQSEPLRPQPATKPSGEDKTQSLKAAPN